jgi:hypothetical protein
MPRLELLKGKSDLERELVDFSLNCAKCGLDVHLGQWSWDHARSLGAPGTRAARRTGAVNEWLRFVQSFVARSRSLQRQQA